MADEVYFVGVDVGTSSVRAALVTDTGSIVSTATQAITIWEPQTNFYEQSSEDIWRAVCTCVKTVVVGVDKQAVRGIGFDATCSLVVLDTQGKPLSVSPTGDSQCNVVMWMDHRAAGQAERINGTGHSVLKFVGGKISPEMDAPKLLWLKENQDSSWWQKVGHFFELPDFLTWKATGSLTRSVCPLVCKMTFQASSDGTRNWNREFFTQIGLGDLTHDNYAKLGNQTQLPGEPVSEGLTQIAAKELGLSPGSAVATSLIDAHAGTMGTLGCVPEGSRPQEDVPLTARLALICGTSTCHMTVSQEPVFVDGVWGPYYSAIVPGFWGNEGGQSATGKLLDHIVLNHPAYPWIKEDADKKGLHPHIILNEVLEFICEREGLTEGSTELTHNLHVWPDFHGNRSPLADPTLKGMVSGLSLAVDVESLAVLYLATLQALAYGTRHIIDVLKKAGHEIKLVLACGGLSKNPVFVQTHADVTGMAVVLPEATESVLLGSAMLGATASQHFSNIQDAMKQMGGKGKVISPNEHWASYHRKKYDVFLRMYEHQREYQKIMEQP